MLAGVALAYWIAVRFGLLLVARPEGIASVWPASGVALAVLLLQPKRQWGKLLAVIFITNAAGNWGGGNSLPVSFGFALVNIAEAVLGAWVLTGLCKPAVTFERTLDSLVLLLVAILCNGVTALLGAAVPAVAFHSSFVHSWAIWWAADGLGMMLVTPFIVSWVLKKGLFSFASPRRVVEAVLIGLTLSVFAWLTFGSFTTAETPLLRNYMVFPLLAWLAFRFSPRGVVTVLLVFSVIAIWNTMQGHGIFSFASQTRTEHLVSLQMFLAVVICSGLFLSSMVAGRRQAEAAVEAGAVRYRQMARRLEMIREEERRRVACELHDDIGQTLTALKIDLSMVQNECSCAGEVKDRMGGMQRMLSEGIQSVHSLCHWLRPGALDDMGLEDALDDMVSDWKQCNRVECELYLNAPDEKLTDEIKTAVFRVVQESLTNVSRYAYASHVEINLVADGEALRFSIADNGCGMASDVEKKPTSFGLLGMRERIEALGGELCIRSCPDAGTRIDGTIPLRQAECS